MHVNNGFIVKYYQEVHDITVPRSCGARLEPLEYDCPQQEAMLMCSIHDGTDQTPSLLQYLVEGRVLGRRSTGQEALW